MTKRDIEYNVPLRLPIPGEDTEAMFRRLVAFSYAVGRQYRADGGPAEEPGAEASRFVREELARPSEAEQAQIREITRPSPLLDQYSGYGAREAVQQNVSRPMPTAHEFVQHQLKGNEPQLPQMDREAYQRMKEYSVLPLELAAYEIPGAGQALAAVDLARSIGGLGSALRTGDKADVAGSAAEAGMAASGTRGKLAKMAAAAMAGLMPEEAEAGTVGKALRAIRAYHGSPYAFDRFDLSKIGTGEGAQVYGHGLYFAESEPVARSYRDNLQRVKPSDLPEYFSPGNVVPSYFGKDKVLDFKQDKDGHFEVLVQEINNAGEPVGAPRVHSTRPSVESFKQVTGKNPGHMYEVDIHADPEHFLDWDAYLSDQSPILQKAVRGIAETSPLRDNINAIVRKDREAILRGQGPISGKNIYENLGGYSRPQETSEALREAGIPGIKYLDQGSRVAGEGSRNYVMFSHDPVEILRRYNQGGHVLEDDYPTPSTPSRSSLSDLLNSIFGHRSGYDQGGGAKGEVSFLEDEKSPLPTFAQPQAQEVTQALDAAREVNQPKKEYEPFGVLPLKETEAGIEFDPYAGVLGSVTRPAKYFYETMSGQKEMEPTSEEAIRSAIDIAGGLTMGAGAFERPAGAMAAGASRPVSETPGEAQAGAVEKALLALHNLKSHRLGMTEKLGGLPVPSIAIKDPSHGFTDFGDITMVGGRELATPSRLNPVFASDVYSPRFPSLSDDGEKIFRGFTPSGARRYAPLTMENVVREMKGNVRGGENYNYGAGNVRSSVTPQFRSLKDIQFAREQIIPKEEFEPYKQRANEMLFELADKFHPYSRYSNTSFGHSGSFAETLSDIGKGRSSAWSQDYKDLPDNLKKEAMDYLAYLRNMPTEYFEAKPQRAVNLEEFAGAVVPEDIIQEISPRLKNLGVREIVSFRPEETGSQQKAFREFRHLGFNSGGSVIDDALRVSSNIANAREPEAA